jgi:hypothetical protein
MSPEEMARKFHETYEHLAPMYGYKTRKGSRVAWEDLSEPLRQLMVATCREIIISLEKDKT